ncbi:MAG: ankyrin repeat domain-containing protein [Gammaproteobacteria bacterium]|nr:ankyrin repeat domain-containing protein [Gammaproteobacteria bacterium]
MLWKDFKCLLFSVLTITSISTVTVFAQESGDNKAAGKQTSPPVAPPKKVEKFVVPKIYLAAKEGRLSRLKSLIAEGADVNASNASGRTALMSAVLRRNSLVVKELLREGANVDVGDAQGKTALMLAVAQKDLAMISLLLASGADVKIEDKKENTALTLAEKSDLSRSKRKKLVKMLERAAE